MNKALIGAALLASFALVGCGTLSKVDIDGKTDEPVFPQVEDVNFTKGSYPNLDNLRQVGDGLTRDQLFELLGTPHSTYAFQGSEWDYLFYFNTAQGRKTCQFKVLFDQERLARSFYWAPAECANILDQKPISAPAQPFSLSGDVGFAFGSAALTTVGRNTVNDIAGQLRQVSNLQQVTVSGHTDRIGSDAANLRLSQQRAGAVRKALVAQGIAASAVQAKGFGKTRPMVHCDQQDRSELIACLAPNRRVDIEVLGQR